MYVLSGRDCYLNSLSMQTTCKKGNYIAFSRPYRTLHFVSYQLYVGFTWSKCVHDNVHVVCVDDDHVLPRTQWLSKFYRHCNFLFTQFTAHKSASLYYFEAHPLCTTISKHAIQVLLIQNFHPAVVTPIILFFSQRITPTEKWKRCSILWNPFRTKVLISMKCVPTYIIFEFLLVGLETLRGVWIKKHYKDLFSVLF